MAEQEDRIVMTPKKKTARSTTLMMERKKVEAGGNVSHVAGGEHKGIVINKQVDQGSSTVLAHLCLEFRVFLVNSSSGKHAQEKRLLSFWFVKDYPQAQRPRYAQEFFKELVSPTDFPRDYVGFIKKIMKLMQRKYAMFLKVEVELTQEMEIDNIPDRPTSAEPTSKPVASEEKLLDMIEASYPNPLTLDAMCGQFLSDENTIRLLLSELQIKKKIRTMENNLNAFTRVQRDEEKVTVVKQMPKVEKAKQPTIAIITSQYYEKTAVDAMMTNRQTFVRYATVGETNVYTLGDMGCHRVVSTKLPMTGHTREASIATGSSTTRLLGTFQDVEYVFLVGVGGGVPHYTDYKRHVRLGDVVLSAPNREGPRFIYQYCETAEIRESGEVVFETKSWCPPELTVQLVANQILDTNNLEEGPSPWEKNYKEAMLELRGEDGENKDVVNVWQRPPPETDKLFMSIGGGDLIEVGHPAAPEGDTDHRTDGVSVLHLGPVASGRGVALDDQLRQEFAYKNGILAYDPELDSVVEGIYGNRKDTYMLIRGIADYKDGSRRKEWQHYSALMAASVLKTIVQSLELPVNN